MDHTFREMFEGLKHTAEGLIMANEGLKRMADAALHAQTEQEDLRDTVGRLETLVMAQGQMIRELRDRLNGGTPP
jgi:hypothetical protein